MHDLIPAAHHRRWIEALTNPNIKRLLIISPPGHAKSTWVSELLICSLIGQDPETNIILVSNTAVQAELPLGVVRETIEGNSRYRSVFPDVRPDYNRGWSQRELFVQRRVKTNKDATVFATGVGGPLIGRRADVIVVDDANDEENTATEDQRQKVITWHSRTLMSRLKPGGREIVITTRWAENDLAGALIATGLYHVIHMPAIGADGQALWPEVWPLETLLGIKTEVGSAIFNCTWQGDPSALAGDVFHKEWFKNYDVIPDGLTVLQAWDLAISKKESADYCVGITAGVNKDSDIYILDVVRERLTFHQQQLRFKSVAEDWEPAEVGIETTAYQAAAFQEAVRGSLWPFRELKPDKDKVTRARPVAARAEAGKVYVRKKAAWWDALETELLAFPRGAHDDQVDALSGVVLLARMRQGRRLLPSKAMVGGRRRAPA